MDERPSALFSRRSVWKYADTPVSKVDVKALLEAGMAAPSANNRKPWHFVTVTSRLRLNRLAATHPHGKMLASARLCIGVCGDRDAAPDFWVQDCSAATENILVAAAMLGLGAVWLGVHPRVERERELKRFLGIPENVGLLCLIAVGHPAEHPAARTQYDEQRVHRVRWQAGRRTEQPGRGRSPSSRRGGGEVVGRISSTGGGYCPPPAVLRLTRGQPDDARLCGFS